MSLAKLLRMAITAHAFFFLTASSPAGALTPVQVVETYLRLAQGKPNKSASILASNATYIVFDMGGPMAETFPEFIRQMNEAGCLMSAPVYGGRIDDDMGVDGDAVKVEWKCDSSKEDAAQSATVRFFVAKQRILGALFEDPPGYRAHVLPE